MTPEEFRTYGYAAIDWVAHFLEHTREFPVLPDARPGDLVDEKPVLLKYGAFIQAVIDFLIIAFCVFLLVKGVNSMQKPKPAAAPPEPPADVKLLTEIRDLLARR